VILKNISIKATPTHRFFGIKSNNAIQSVQYKQNLVSETKKEQKNMYLMLIKYYNWFQNARYNRSIQKLELKAKKGICRLKIST
jgi:hypothetical protein